MVTAATVLQVDAFERFPVIRREGFVSKHHGIYSKEAKSFQCMYIIYMYEWSNQNTYHVCIHVKIKC